MNLLERDRRDTRCVYEFERIPNEIPRFAVHVIGAYDYAETRDSNDVLIRVYTPFGKKEQGLFALHTISKILPFYGEYFGIKYPLSKFELMATINLNFGTIDLESIAFYGYDFLVDSYDATLKIKQKIALILAYELMDSWFENLRTIGSSNNSWIYEVTRIQFLAVNHVYPEYDIWTISTYKVSTCTTLR